MLEIPVSNSYQMTYNVHMSYVLNLCYWSCYLTMINFFAFFLINDENVSFLKRKKDASEPRKRLKSIIFCYDIISKYNTGIFCSFYSVFIQ